MGAKTAEIEAKPKEFQLDLGRKTGICSVCGGRTITQVVHVGGLDVKQQAAHTLPSRVDPIKLANPLTAEELAARDEAEALRLAVVALNADMRALQERMEDAQGGFVVDGNRYTTIKPNRAKFDECKALHSMLFHQLEAAEQRALKASGKYHTAMAARSRRLETLRQEQERAHALAGKGKPSLLTAGLARIRAALGT